MIEISGFETAGISASTAQEISDAVDMVLPKYKIGLSGIEIADLDGTLSYAEDRIKARPPDSPEVGTPKSPERWIVLDRGGTADPRLLPAGQERTPRHWIECAGQHGPMTTTMLRELGHVTDLAGRLRARGTAQRALITEYTRANGRGETLARIVHGYRQWRGQLSGYCFDSGVLVPGRALAESFALVELHGSKAPAQAKVLHRLLVAMAELETA